MEKFEKINFIPKTFPNYSDKEYWKNRYQNLTNETFDWYEDYDTIKPSIDELKLSKRSKILNIGIGNSEFSERLYDDGYKKNFNIDICRNVIKFMRDRNKKIRTGLYFETMDAMHMSYDDEEFDVVFDKGTFDCILCGIDAEGVAHKFLKEVDRVLKGGGYYFLISNSPPENRIDFLQGEGLSFEIDAKEIVFDQKIKFADDFEEVMKKGDDKKKDHYIYICKKMKGSEE